VAIPTGRWTVSARLYRFDMRWPWRKRAGSAVAAQPPGYQLSTFGDPATAAEHDLLDALPCVQQRLLPDDPNQLTNTALQLGARLVEDLPIIQASHRWTPGAADPLQFAPGDVLALRYFATDPLVRQAIRILRSLQDPAIVVHLSHRRAELLRRVRYTLSLAQLQLEAASYFLPLDSAISILASTPPTDQLVDAIRLPFPALSVYFGADLAIDQRFIRWSEGHLTERPGTAQALAELYTLPGETAATQDIVLTLRELGGYLSGMTLQADGDGRLADHVLWIVATNPTPNASQLAQHDRLRGTAAGYLPAATLRPLALNLAAAVSWGAWTPPRPPVDLPDEAGSRPWRQAVNTGAFRRAERAGAYAAVRVLDLERTTRPGRPRNAQPGQPARSRPRAHDRRGYWNFYRCGPRDDWHYEGRWIPPRRINADLGDVVPGRPIYRLPVPEAAAVALGLEEPA
jgi:hypothetical protein